MSGKMLILLGLIASAALMFFCINSKKDELYTQLNQTNTTAVEDKVPQTVIKPSITTTRKSPSFAFISGEQEKFACFLSTKDQDSNITKQLKSYCQNTNCVQKIEFFDDIKPFTFTQEAFELIAYAKKEKLKNFAIYLDNNTLKIEGELKTQEQQATIKPFFDDFINQGYKIDNKLKAENLLPLVKEEILEEKITQEMPDTNLVTPTHISLEDAQKEIAKIIKENTITFDYRSSEISKESKKSLDAVIDILLGLDDVNIEVAGYTDAKGDTIYNKVLSQKRADSVRTYLIKSGIRAQLIKSKGYGEENPIGKPEDIINRRVEIHLSEGK